MMLQISSRVSIHQRLKIDCEKTLKKFSEKSSVVFLIILYKTEKVTKIGGPTFTTFLRV